MFIRNHWSVLGQGLIFKSQIAQKRKNGDYYIGTDGSNNEWLVKRHSLLVQVFDDDKGEVIDQLLDFGTAKANHAKFFFQTIDSALQNFDVWWQNCVDVGSGNTVVNVKIARATKRF